MVDEMAGTVKRDTIKGICLHEFDTVVVFILYNIYFPIYYNIEKKKEKKVKHTSIPTIARTLNMYSCSVIDK